MKASVPVRLAFQKKRIEIEESVRQLALWLVRSRAGLTITENFRDWNYESEKEARKAWKRENVLKDEVDYPHFLSKLRQFIYVETPAWQSH